MVRFAFLIHPRDKKDIVKKYRFAKFFPQRWIEKMINFLGFRVCSQFEVERKGKKALGYLVGVGFTASQIFSLSKKLIRKKILESVIFCQKNLKAKIIGLGALLASITEGGKWLIGQKEINSSITHGDTLAVAIAQEGIGKILKNSKRWQGKEIKIGIVGAFGIIGREIAKFLGKKGYPLILIEKNKKKTKKILDYLKSLNPFPKILYAGSEIKMIKNSDFIITATSHPKAFLNSSLLKEKAIIYDIAQPQNISPKVLKERKDIIAIDGCLVNIEGIDLRFDMGPPKGTTFACLVETILMAFEKDFSHHVGQIDENYLKKVKKWAQKYNFSHAPFVSFGRSIFNL